MAEVRPVAQVRHEALARYVAAGAGPAVPGVVAVGETPDDGGLLALDLIEGSPLVELPPEAVTDDLLHRVWGEVGQLHRGRVAHGRLSTD